jgi:hypothetical protein
MNTAQTMTGHMSAPDVTWHVLAAQVLVQIIVRRAMHDISSKTVSVKNAMHLVPRHAPMPHQQAVIHVSTAGARLMMDAHVLT